MLLVWTAASCLLFLPVSTSSSPFGSKLHQLYEGWLLLSSLRLFHLHLLPPISTKCVLPPTHPSLSHYCASPQQVVWQDLLTSALDIQDLCLCLRIKSLCSKTILPPRGHLKRTVTLLTASAAVTDIWVRVDLVLFAGPLSEQLKGPH